ncbi:hypothetical protein WN51_14663 [Melipona quadrifasciata]|uniref:Uncharacterized protein n=1 Tax=Melipona quadrifasciata TaxID=166423 RepID=A0A0M8ZZC5_9HYME|nr:hypothetical protein WN51_14663 [Melipona quadrifasciata]
MNSLKESLRTNFRQLRTLIRLSLASSARKACNPQSTVYYHSLQRKTCSLFISFAQQEFLHVITAPAKIAVIASSQFAINANNSRSILILSSDWYPTREENNGLSSKSRSIARLDSSSNNSFKITLDTTSYVQRFMVMQKFLDRFVAYTPMNLRTDNQKNDCRDSVLNLNEKSHSIVS